MNSDRQEREAREALRRFLHAFDARVGAMPNGLDPAAVERWLRAELAPVRPEPGPAGRIAQLVAFYHLPGLVPDLECWLDPEAAAPLASPTAELCSSLYLASAVARVGDAAARARARASYLRLFSGPAAPGALAELVAHYPHHAPELEPAAVARALDACTAEDVTQRGTRDQLATSELPWLAAAVTRREAIARTPAIEARLGALVELYLGIDADYREALLRWAAESIERIGRAGAADEVAAAFRRAQSRIDAVFTDSQAREAAHARAAHALERYALALGKEEEERVLPAQKRYDLLSVR